MCEEESGLKRENESVNVSVSVCECGHLLTCKLVSLLRAVSPEGTERPSPSTWMPSGISPSNIGVSPTPILIMPNLSFYPRDTEKEGKQWADGCWHT